MNSIFDAIKTICKDELSVDLVESHDTSDKLINFGIDSIGLMTLVVYLEEKYNIEIALDTVVEKAYNDVSFDDVIDLVSENE